MGSIFLLRHGQTVANRDRILQGPRIDAELSDLGRQQADSLGNALAQQPLGALYCSPLTRARDTAQAIARRHQRNPGGRAAPRDGLAVQVAPEIYEMDYGHLAGRPYDEIAGEMEQVLDAWSLGFIDQAFPGGESPALAQLRLRPFANRVWLEAQSGDVAVVAHGRINRILIATLTGAGLTRLEEFPQSNASITELSVSPDAVDIVRLNDVTHLNIVSDSPA